MLNMWIFVIYLCLSTGFFIPLKQHSTVLFGNRQYPLSQKYFEQSVKRLNSKNITIQNQEILNNDDGYRSSRQNNTYPGLKITISPSVFNNLFTNPQDDQNDQEGDDYYRKLRNTGSKSKKSENFEVINNSLFTFNDVGGYDSVKQELNQCIDLLQNYTKYSKYNVRVPKGIIFEGPPGNGKTLLAKSLAGEARTGFIAVSGSEFQEKYVGVGAARIRELFKLAKKNIPCIVFIDEIDAVGRSRGKNQDESSERDNTLNELLVALDGFKNNTGVFLIGATNRADLLDPALLRPGRIDKRIYIGNPDAKTRAAIIKIHSPGKPRDSTVVDEDLVEITNGFSCAQIENLLNEAMLNALRYDRHLFNIEDIDIVYNKMMAGWQPTEHQLTSDIIDHIAIHEMGHAIVGLISKHHSKMSKVIINLSSPTSPGYTVFESPTSTIYTREALFEHLMILLAGRIAEEVFYGISVTTGAINDFEEALKLSKKMITYYGMGEEVIYPDGSEKYKEIIDNEISNLIQDAYRYAEYIVKNSKELIFECAELLKENKLVRAEELIEIINDRYEFFFDLIQK